jgi:DHA1 family tetracycline resistance protein-like MFS transporter
MKRQAAVSFIFITILVDVIGLGIIIPVLPKLIEELIGGNISQASEYGGWLMASYAILQFFFSPILGGLSDRFGRRPVLLLSLLGFGIDYFFQAWAPNIIWLFVGRILAGVMGASYTTASAYIADISTPEKRSQNFGMIGAAFGLGFIVGPIIGGALGGYGSRVPFIAAAILTLLNCLYGYFILPESLASENRRPFEFKRANPFGTLITLKKYPLVAGLIGSFLLVAIAGHSAQSTWTFYTMYKFNWNITMVGYSLGFVGLMIAIVQGGLTRVLIPKLGNDNAVYFGLVFFTIGNILFAFASSDWMMFAFLIPYALGGISGPAMQGIISNEVPANEQGELQGGLTSLMSITSIVGPILMTNLFSYFTGSHAPIKFPGAPFLMAAILTLVSIFLAKDSLIRKNKTKDKINAN